MTSRALSLLTRYTPLFIGALALALLASPVARAAAHTSVTIAGVVVNGTHQQAPVANQIVTLQVVGPQGVQDADAAQTDASGRFAFVNVANSGTEVYTVATVFQQGNYSSPALSPDATNRATTTLAVYDATASDATLRIAHTTALFRDARPMNGLIGVGEFFTFENTGSAAFVGSVTPANGKPMGLLRFALPPGATNVTLGKGFAGAQAIQVPSGFGASVTVPPGASEFAFAFDVPYTGASYPFTFKTEYPTLLVSALIPAHLDVAPGDFTTGGEVTASGEQYKTVGRTAVAAGTSLALTIHGLPRAGEQALFQPWQLIILAATLALLLLLALALYLRRGSLATLWRRVADAPVAGSAALEAERDRLLRALLALERSSTKGDGDQARLRLRTTEMRAALRTVLLQLDAPKDASPAPTTVVAPASDDEATPERAAGATQAHMGSSR